jgi:hypothetical protein
MTMSIKVVDLVAQAGVVESFSFSSQGRQW